MLELNTRADQMNADNRSRTHLAIHTLEAIVDRSLTADEEEASVRHLQACSTCRSRLRERLARAPLSSEHPATQLLEEADEWSRYANAGEEATVAERDFLRAHGVNPAYQRAGVLVEEYPDGSVRPIADADQVPKAPLFELAIRSH